MDLKGASEQLTQRTEQNTLQEKQKQQENQEQLAALETFGKALQKAGQIRSSRRTGRRNTGQTSTGPRQAAAVSRFQPARTPASHRLVGRL